MPNPADLKSKTIQIRITKLDEERLDALCKENQTSRSVLIRELVRQAAKKLKLK